MVGKGRERVRWFMNCGERGRFEVVKAAWNRLMCVASMTLGVTEMSAPELQLGAMSRVCDSTTATVYADVCDSCYHQRPCRCPGPGLTTEAM